MAAPSNTVWGSIVGDEKLGIAISANNENTRTTLTVEVWLALKYSISDNYNEYAFSYTNDSGTTTTSSESNLALSFGTNSGSGWADVSQKQIKTYTLYYTRGTSSKVVNFSAKLNNLGSGDDDISVSTSYTIPVLPSYTVSYNANGGTGSMSSSSATYGSAFKTRQNTFKRTGYTFAGWNEKSDGTGAKWGITSSDSGTYESGNSWTWTYQKNITLYAQWTENSMTVYYHGNGADYCTYKGNIVDIKQDSSVHSDVFLYDNAYNSGLSNIQNTSYLYLSRTGYEPTGYWLTAGTNYISVHEDDVSLNTGEKVAKAFNMTLANSSQSIKVYAEWVKNNYTFNYNANGGYGSISTQNVQWGDTFTLSKNSFKKDGYRFSGWNIRRNDNKWYVNYQGWLTEDEIASGGYMKKAYENQDELVFDKSWINENDNARTFTLYAIWEKIDSLVYIDNGVSFEPYLVYIDNGESWDLYVPYMDNGVNWDIMN